MKTTNARKNNLPPPFNNIEYKTEGKVLGKQIQMKNNLQTSTKHRLHKARKTWHRTRRNISRNPILYEKTRTALRNAIIRSTLTYALHARIHKLRETIKLEQFQLPILREIRNPKWYLQTRKPPSKELHKHYKQPAINTWLQKMAIAQHLRQTTQHWTIHTKNHQ